MHVKTKRPRSNVQSLKPKSLYSNSDTESDIINFLSCRNVHDSIQKNNETQMARLCGMYHQIRELRRLEETCTQQRALCIVLYDQMTWLFLTVKHKKLLRNLPMHTTCDVT